MYRTTDNGATWTAVGIGLTSTLVSAFAVLGENLFAGTEGGGVYLSTNDGTNWTAANNGLTNRSVLTLAVKDADLFAGTWGGGVFHSTNNGASWTPANNGLTNTSVFALAVTGTNLFAGTFGGGVFRSTNSGGSWDAVNAGLTSTNVMALAISGDYLYAGTWRGVWRRPLSELVSVQSELELRFDRFSLEQNYPNPFNPSTTFNYHLPMKSHVVLQVFDLLGREVASLVNRIEEPGYKSVQWNAGNLTSGVYFYRLRAGQLIQTRKMLLVR